MKDQNLADTMKHFRKENQLSQEAAAYLLGIPVRTIEYIESGRGFRYPKAIKLAMQSVTMAFKPYEVIEDATK